MSNPIKKSTVDIKDIKSVNQWFHDELIPVYPTEITFEQITYWPKNFRTELDFDLLSQQTKKPLEKLSVDEITDYLARQKLKISDLSKSIQRNGVRIPLIILSDGTLLDGNRRYFACAFLKKKTTEKKQPRPPVLDRIPVWVIKTEDIDVRKRTKILAEMNFVTDLKMDWPLSVKARLVAELYHRCLKEKKNELEALKEIKDLYAVDGSTAKAYIDTIEITQKFIRSTTKKQRDSRRSIVQDKFVYFWEFRNKGMEGNLDLDPKKEFPKVEKLFFTMIANNRIDNIKQIEPVIWSVRHDYEWQLLESSGGSKIEQVEASFKETKAIRSAEDKIRGFYRWLAKVDPHALQKQSLNLLRSIEERCREIINA